MQNLELKSVNELLRKDLLTYCRRDTLAVVRVMNYLYNLTGEKMNKNIRIEWEGPFSLEDIGYDKENDNYKKSIKNPLLCNENTAYGVYQVYGYHPVYGNDVLLYIGKAEQQTFAKRLSQEGWQSNADSNNLKFYIGRLFGEKNVSEDEWDKMISTAERMLIYAHEPARNSSNILNITKNKNLLKEFEDIRIFNYDNSRSLMPEVSGELWIKNFEDYNGVFSVELLEDQ